MQFVIDGETFSLDQETVTGRLRGRPPEPIHMHWVQVGGVQFPVKQALEVSLRLGREAFTSHRARSIFDRLQFPTSTGLIAEPEREGPEPRVTSPSEAADAFEQLVSFLRASPFTAGIGQLEHDLVNTDSCTASAVTHAAGLTEELLTAALIVRRDVGRVSDVVHAAVISLMLPLILEPGEIISNRPSLGPSNDKSRQFDLQTNRRVAEFKVALWLGGDMMRKRGVTADLVHLAMDDSGLRPELWVAGSSPLRFLETSTSPVGNLLSRSSRHLRTRFEGKYGTADIPLCEFAATQAAHVQRRNLADVLPAVAAALL